MVVIVLAYSRLLSRDLKLRWSRLAGRINFLKEQNIQQSPFHIWLETQLTSIVNLLTSRAPIGQSFRETVCRTEI